MAPYEPREALRTSYGLFDADCGIGLEVSGGEIYASSAHRRQETTTVEIIEVSRADRPVTRRC